MGRAMCEYDGGPDVTRFAALKSKHKELQRRVTLFEDFIRLLPMRPEVESVKIIGRMRIANIETDLEDLVKFIKNADLLVRMASAQSDQTPLASGEPSVDTHLPTMPLDDISSLIELL
ncbi:uncharacterized protein ColSpa_12019 [Colletotrichum spaethianum]|uniref:Uncharacterized protein n=1 Tax=Colletotrichum spaethianum TaxID=700344 RepID=A0AA37PGM5_9PEZI|nr:uncharacterized protein ColSpa_12019 [Colletotrichum spaethianum]GKT51838.1 hypothetical protein ColSpa_12019 [Colletotrichum spaethianum]